LHPLCPNLGWLLGGLERVMTAERFTNVSSSRLDLRVPESRDFEDVFDLYTDPEVWADDPVNRHTAIVETERMIGRWRDAWFQDGLGLWVATSREPETIGLFVWRKSPPGCRLLRGSSTRKLHKRLHTYRTLGQEQVDLNEKAPTCGAFAEPSDGLEPSTPSLPWRICCACT